MSKATDAFKNDPYVKDFYQKAQENEQIMNGMKEIPADPAAMSAPVAPANPNATPAPTPNDLAKPSQPEK
jgi:hypothetical protein